VFGILEIVVNFIQITYTLCEIPNKSQMLIIPFLSMHYINMYLSKHNPQLGYL